MSTSIQDLAMLIFKKNENDAYINLSLDGLNNAFELFSFYTNLVSQGIGLLCGETDLETVDPKHFQDIMRKLRFAGVEFRIDILPKPQDHPGGVFIVITGDGASLQDFSMHIISSSALYVARFALFHNVVPHCHIKGN